MNFDELENVWRSSANQPSTVKIEEQKMKFINDLERRRRGFVLFMSIVFTMLVVITGMLLRHLLWPDPARSAIDLEREWAIVPLLLAPWVAWIWFVAQYWRHRACFRDGNESIEASLRALLDENRMARRRNWIVGGLQITFLCALPLVVYQLKSVGKAGGEIDVMLVLVPLLFGGILAGLIYHHRRKLLPRKRELESLLNSYEAEA